MFSWWYTQGWLQNLHMIEKRLQSISHVFAVKVLLKTWFSPWKQIQTQSSFATFFRDIIDNTVSRVIGGLIRTFILFAALILSICVITLGGVMLITWPFIPLLVVILPIMSMIGALI